MFAHFSCDDQDVEVHTLRREKKELKDELEETKTKQLNFEAAFQTEFDLRTTMEEKYDSLRERYEVKLCLSFIIYITFKLTVIHKPNMHALLLCQVYCLV